MLENRMLTITVTNAEEYNAFYQELKSEYPGTYRINVDSFGADSFVQIVIPLVGIIAGSSVLSKLIEKIFDRNVINIDILGGKFSGNIKNLPKAIEYIEKQTQDNSSSTPQ